MGFARCKASKGYRSLEVGRCLNSVDLSQLSHPILPTLKFPLPRHRGMPRGSFLERKNLGKKLQLSASLVIHDLMKRGDLYVRLSFFRFSEKKEQRLLLCSLPLTPQTAVCSPSFRSSLYSNRGADFSSSGLELSMVELERGDGPSNCVGLI
jgi:hypothetical protein